MASRNDAMSFVDWFDSYIIQHNHVCMYEIAMSGLIKLLSPQGEMCITPLLLGVLYLAVHSPYLFTADYSATTDT